MTDRTLLPNELADLYDALFTVLENLPEDTHPGWQLAIEALVLGGEGLATDATAYGEQQAERNPFSITTYRQEYGDGERVTEFPTLATRRPRPDDRTYVDADVELPVVPDSDEVLPLAVDGDELSGAVALLAEFPALPAAELPGDPPGARLDAGRFPGMSIVDDQSEGSAPVGVGVDGDGVSRDPPPNRLADHYEAFYLVLESLPEHAPDTWQEAIETMVFGGEGLAPDARNYGEQQAERNGFTMETYREEYGDGERVTEFPTLATRRPRPADRPFVDSDVEVPVAPESDQVLPLVPDPDDLEAALSLLTEFPAEPAAEDPGRRVSDLINPETWIPEGSTAEPVDQSHRTSPQRDTDVADGPPGEDGEVAERAADVQTPDSNVTSAENETASVDPDPDQPDDTKVLRDHGPIETSETEPIESPGSQERKYEDPRAERAHRRAQRQEPSDVVELGEEIRLVIQEADHSSYPPTIMGTKNKLVVFVTEAPQDVTPHDVVRAQVVDYGGNNNSAEAVFLRYDE